MKIKVKYIGYGKSSRFHENRYYVENRNIKYYWNIYFIFWKGKGKKYTNSIAEVAKIIIRNIPENSFSKKKKKKIQNIIKKS